MNYLKKLKKNILSISKKILKASVGFSLFKYFSFIVGILGQIILARLISPEFFIPFISVLALLEIIYAFGSIGLGNILLSYQNEKAVYGTAIYLVSLLSIILFIISVILGRIILGKEFLTIILLLSLSKSVSMYFNIFSAYLEKDFNHTLIGFIEFLSKSIAFAFAIYMVLNGFKTESLVIRELSFTILQILFLFFIVFKKIDYSFNLSTAKKILLFSYKFIYLALLEVSLRNIPILFLGKTNGNDSAFYEKSSYLGGLPVIMLSPVNSKISYSYYVKVKNEMAKVKKAIFLNIFISFRLLLPFSLILYFYNREIINFLFGENWIDAGPYLKALSMSFLLVPLLDILKFYLISVNQIHLVSKIKLYSLLGLIALIYFIYLNSFSLVFVAWSFSIVSLISFLFFLIYVFFKLKISYIKIFLFPIISCLFSLIIILAFQLNWIFNSFLFLLTYLVLLLILEIRSYKDIMRLFY